MAVNIVIPMKGIDAAKHRLAAVLAADARATLVRCLYRRALRFFNENFPGYPLAVVTPAAAVAAIAEAHGARVIREPAAAGLSAAAARAAAWSARRGFASQLLVPADIARLDRDEIARLLCLDRPSPSIIVCPAADRGTNALLTTPPGVIPFAFGPHSSRAHRQAAIRRHIPWQTLSLARLSRDIDTPADLAELAPAAAPAVSLSALP